jgi:hypothetical protein
MREVQDAAERVLQAMRALDAYRHDGAPTLEREYRRALEAYFVAAEEALGRDRRAIPDEALEDAPPPEETSRAEELRRERAAVEGHFAAARRALRLAREYRREPGSSGRRERECIAAAQRHRAAIHALHLKMRPPPEQLALPGLVKTRPDESLPSQRVARAG